MKTVYLFDEITGLFVAPYTAQESPLEPGVYIAPHASTDNAPPSVSAGEGLRWNGAAWEILPAPAPIPVVIPSHADLSAAVLSYARALRTKLFAVVDGLQSSALALGNANDATAIEAFKAGLRSITKIDLSAATTDAQMRALVLVQYKVLASAAPASVQVAFLQAMQ